MNTIELINAIYERAVARGVMPTGILVDPDTYQEVSDAIYEVARASGVTKVTPVLTEVIFRDIPVQTDREKLLGTFTIQIEGNE